MTGPSIDSNAPRKRAPRKRADLRAERSSASSQVRRPVRSMPDTAPPETAQAQKKAPEPIKAKTRKAPTPLAGQKASAQHRRKQQVVAVVLIVLGVGASAAVGFTDKGQIDVRETIEARNERIRNNTTDDRDVVTSNIEVPVQAAGGAKHTAATLRPIPNTGLGAAKPKVPQVAAATSTASTSDQTASSSAAVASSTVDKIAVDESSADTEDAEGTLSEEADAPTE